jgi:hypothetical protein
MRSQHTRQYQLTAIDFEILKLVKQFHFLTCDLLQTLRGLKSKPKLQTKLKRLYEAGFLDRRSLPSAGVGAKEYIYALSTRGIRILEEQGLTGFSRFRPDEFRTFAFPFLHHCISLNSLLAAAFTLERFVPVSLTELRHDLDLRHSPIRVAVDRRMPDGSRVNEKMSLVPDAWLDFRMVVPGSEKPRRRCIAIELDMGTAGASPMKQKFRSYYWCAISAEYKERFADRLIVAYTTTAGQARLKQLVAWCEQELTQQQLEREANLYRFCSLPQGGYTPQEIFCSPLWFKPFDSTPTSLLWPV